MVAVVVSLVPPLSLFHQKLLLSRAQLTAFSYHHVELLLSVAVAVMP
jgi:hypothetical protein